MEDRASASRPRRSNTLVTVLLIAMVVGLIAFPLAFKSGAEFGGADNAATRTIVEIDPGATPWFQPIWTPPGPEVESLLFALQAALGAGFIGYFFGLKRGARRAADSGLEKGQRTTGGPEVPHLND